MGVNRISIVHSTAIDVQAVARAMWGTAPTGKVVALGSSTAGWARYCINMGVSLPVYAAGYALIESPEGADWLAKGFEAILDEAVQTPILPHSERRNPR
jgi:hypothetical protein